VSPLNYLKGESSEKKGLGIGGMREMRAMREMREQRRNDKSLLTIDQLPITNYPLQMTV